MLGYVSANWLFFIILVKVAWRKQYTFAFSYSSAAPVVEATMCEMFSILFQIYIFTVFMHACYKREEQNF